MIWRHIIWYDVIWHDIIWYNMWLIIGHVIWYVISLWSGATQGLIVTVRYKKNHIEIIEVSWTWTRTWIWIWICACIWHLWNTTRKHLLFTLCSAEWLYNWHNPAAAKQIRLIQFKHNAYTSTLAAASISSHLISSHLTHMYVRSYSYSYSFFPLIVDQIPVEKAFVPISINVIIKVKHSLA